MACRSFTLPDGGFGLICGPAPRRVKCWVTHCHERSTKLCDFPVGRGKTCDNNVCDRHAKSMGPDRDYCPLHSGRPEFPVGT